MKEKHSIIYVYESGKLEDDAFYGDGNYFRTFTEAMKYSQSRYNNGCSSEPIRAVKEGKCFYVLCNGFFSCEKFFKEL